MNKKYIVSATTSPFGEQATSAFHTDDPEKAILEWCKLNKKYPTCVSLQAKTTEDGKALLKWANIHSEKVEAYMISNRCPYKTDWMLNNINLQVNNDKCSMQWEYDELFPFCQG